MNKHIGVKILEHAEPMTNGEYKVHSKEIFKRGYMSTFGSDYDGYLVVYKDGYTSWSPKKEFEETYIALGEDCKITEEQFKECILGAIDCENKIVG